MSLFAFCTNTQDQTLHELAYVVTCLDTSKKPHIKIVSGQIMLVVGQGTINTNVLEEIEHIRNNVRGVKQTFYLLANSQI